MARELDLGGSERQLALLARALDPAKFEPIVGCFRPDGLRARELRGAGVQVEQFPVFSFASPQSIAGAGRLARFIRRRRVRLVHTFDYPLTVFAVPVAKLFTDAVALSSQRSHRDLIPAPYRSLVRFTDHLAAGVVVNCEFLRRHLEQDERVPDNRILVCPNGLDLDEFWPRDEPRPAVLAPDDIVIGTVCALRPEKGLHDLLKAFARVRAFYGLGARLVIIGSGPMRERLESLARELRLIDACLFVSATSEVASWLRTIDIFVLPSHSEAFSNSLMEAMGCGCCAVASRVGGNPELIRHGETGMLFECSDVTGLAATLDLLIKNRSLRRCLAEAGTHWIRQHFSIQSSARRMGQIYADLIERRDLARRPPRAAP